MESRKPATYDDLREVPDHLVAELLYGSVHTSPRPAPKHAHAATRLGFVLGPRWDFGESGPGGWRILHEPELWIEEHVVVPDLAGWRTPSLPTLPTTAHIDTPPDWACEVLSPSTARIDRVMKFTIYQDAGVGWYWLVDPIARLIEVFALENGAYRRVTTAEDQADAALPPFEALPFDVRVLWAD